MINLWNHLFNRVGVVKAYLGVSRETPQDRYAKRSFTDTYGGRTQRVNVQRACFT